MPSYSVRKGRGVEIVCTCEAYRRSKIAGLKKLSRRIEHRHGLGSAVSARCCLPAALPTCCPEHRHRARARWRQSWLGLASTDRIYFSPSYFEQKMARVSSRALLLALSTANARSLASRADKGKRENLYGFSDRSALAVVRCCINLRDASGRGKARSVCAYCSYHVQCTDSGSSQPVTAEYWGTTLYCYL